MPRPIKFRGRAESTVEGRCKEGEWVYGNLIENNGTPYIVGDVMDVDNEYIALEYWIPVVAEGQFTGLLDKNGKEIYEADFIKTKDGEIWLVEPIGIQDSDETFYGLVVTPKSQKRYAIDKSILKGEVIGNIYENPELLK